jgi:curli biogenesis system outer membrane secretion channel CsgG
MKRVLLAMAVFLSLAVIPAVAEVGSADAAVPRKAAVCPSFKVAGVKLQWSVVGSGLTCSSAKKWVSKLAGESVTASTAKVTFTDGPKGFHCSGASDKSGHATIGSCYKGTIQHPTSGFQWFG